MIGPGVLKPGDLVYRIVSPVHGSARASIVVLECKLLERYVADFYRFEITLTAFDPSSIEDAINHVRAKIQKHIETNKIVEKWSYEVIGSSPPRSDLVHTCGAFQLDSTDLYLHREEAIDIAAQLASRSVRKLKRDLRSME